MSFVTSCVSTSGAGSNQSPIGSAESRALRRSVRDPVSNGRAKARARRSGRALFAAALIWIFAVAREAARELHLTPQIAALEHISGRPSGSIGGLDRPRRCAPIIYFSDKRLIRLRKYDCGAFLAKSRDNYATSLRKRCANSRLRRKFIVSKFREAMFVSVSGRFPVAEDRGHLQGQSRDPGQTGRGG